MLLLLVLFCTILPSLVSSIDKSKAVGPCLDAPQRCQPGHHCVENECYPKQQKLYDMKHPSTIRHTRSTDSIGPCVNGFCPKGYDCVDNACYKQKIPEGAKSIGPCVNSRCPDGYICKEEDYKCYST